MSSEPRILSREQVERLTELDGAIAVAEHRSLEDLDYREIRFVRFRASQHPSTP